MQKVTLTLLGTANAAGMPLYGCDCSYCAQAINDATLRRSSCSALLTVNNKQYLIDAGQVNLHQRFPAGTLAGVFVTHFHPDHVQGLFQLRWGKGLSIPIYSPPDSEGCADLYKHPGILDFQPQKKFRAVELGEMTVTPVPLIHSKVTFGYVFSIKQKRIAYLTDTQGLPPSTLALLQAAPLDLMLIDCTYKPGIQGVGHNSLDEVMRLEQLIKPKTLVLIHIDHDFDIWLQQHKHELPANYVVSSDGMLFSLR